MQILSGNWPLAVDQRWLLFTKFWVYFVHFLTALFRYNRFAGIEEAVMNKSACRPLNNHHTILLVHFTLRKCRGNYIAVQPLSQTRPIILEDPVFILRNKSFKNMILFSSQKKCGTHLKWRFLIYLQLVLHPCIDLFLTLSDLSWVLNFCASGRIVVHGAKLLILAVLTLVGAFFASYVIDVLKFELQYDLALNNAKIRFRHLQLKV